MSSIFFPSDCKVVVTRCTIVVQHLRGNKKMGLFVSGTLDIIKCQKSILSFLVFTQCIFFSCQPSLAGTKFRRGSPW